MSKKSVIFYFGKKHESYPEDSIKLTTTTLMKNMTKEMTLVFKPIKLPKGRVKQKLINKLASSIKVMLKYDDGNLNDPVTVKNIKNGVFDERITLKLPDELPKVVTKLKVLLDDSYIHFTMIESGEAKE